jgi:hypothetical protein
MSDKRSHIYHAEAHVLSGDLVLPLAQKIEPQSHSKLPAQGGYLCQRQSDYRLEGVVSFSSAYSHVTGNEEVEKDGSWTTVTTTVVENFNVMEVLTADRIVGQVGLNHPLVGYVPKVTFLGTRFENLRIAGHPVHLDLDLKMMGPKPADDQPYSNSPGFMGRVASQYERMHEHEDLPKEALARYKQMPLASDKPESIECSLVNQAVGLYPGKSYGHVIDVPDFGKIYLATLSVKESDFVPGSRTPKKTMVTLTMVEVQMGCIAHAMLMAGRGVNNGGGTP